MSLLTNPSDLKSSSIFKGLIYGQPGIGKSTLALSAPNPVCIDFDKGMKRVEPQFQTASLQVESYSQVLELLNSEELKGFDTIVIDTLGKLIDRICDYVALQNPRLRQSDGQMVMKGWGNVKVAFHSLLKILESKNKSVIFVAHEAEEKDNEVVIKRPDCAGAARKDVAKELDFMGYMEMVGSKRSISFFPSEKFHAKNSLGLNTYIEVPDTKVGNVFISEKIVRLTDERLKEQASLREEYDTLKALIEGNIESLNTLDELNDYYKEMGSKRVIWDSSFYEKMLLSEKVKELGFEFDKQARVFVDKVEV